VRSYSGHNIRIPSRCSKGISKREIGGEGEKKKKFGNVHGAKRTAHKDRGGTELQQCENSIQPEKISLTSGRGRGQGVKADFSLPARRRSESQEKN